MIQFMDTVIVICAVITAVSTAAIAVELIFDWSVVWPQIVTMLDGWGLDSLASIAQLR